MSVLFCKYLCNKSSDLYEISNLNSKDSNELPKKNRKDLCTHTRTRGVNMRARVSSRQNTRTHIYPSCARVFAWIFTKNFLMILNYLMNISLKFHKDRSIRRGDICKTILSFKSYQFSMYFAYFNKYPPPKPSKMDNY